MILGEMTGTTLGRIVFSPNHGGNKALIPKHLVHHHPCPMDFVIIQRHPETSVFRQQFMQQFQAWVHHAQPLVMPQHVLLVDGVAVQPLLQHWAVDVVVVVPVSCCTAGQ